MTPKALKEAYFYIKFKFCVQNRSNLPLNRHYFGLLLYLNVFYDYI